MMEKKRRTCEGASRMDALATDNSIVEIRTVHYSEHKANMQSCLMDQTKPRLLDFTVKKQRTDTTDPSSPMTRTQAAMAPASWKP